MTVSVELQQFPLASVLVRDGRFLAVNRLFEELTGWTSEALVGKPMIDSLKELLSPSDLEIVAHRMRSHPPDGPRTGGRLWCRIRSASGGEIPVRVEWRHDASGRDTMVTLVDAQPEAFGLEVTEALARAAGTLAAAQNETEILDQAVTTLSARDFTATVLLIAPGDPLLKYGPSRSPKPTQLGTAALPRPPREILSLINPAFMQRRAAFFQDGVRLVREAFPEPVAVEVARLLPAQNMVQAPLFVDGAPYGALVVTSAALSPLVATALELFAELVGRAIENLRLRKENVERERLAALGEAAAVMAHEVRNPVGAIMNALALLKRDPPTSELSASLLDIVGEESARLEHVVSQLLDLGRPMLPRPRLVPLEDVVTHAVAVLTARGQLRDRALELPDAGATVASLDPDLMELAVTNVLRNAEQSTGRGGRIRVRADAAAGLVRLVVEDDGPGFPDEVRARIGQPFITTRATGTGVGLALVRRILEASGGRLGLERSALGGASVVLELPTESRDTV